MRVERIRDIRRVKIAVIVLSCIFLSKCISGGCDFPGDLFTVGVRVLEWNGMGVRQEGSRFNPEGISSFSYFWHEPTEGRAVITVRMPDGKFVGADALGRETLKAYLRNGVAYEDQYGRIFVNYSRGKMSLSFDDTGRMRRVGIDMHVLYTHRKIPGRPPAISMPGGDKVLEFPLTEKELKELFGKPTKDETYLFAT